MAFPTAPVNGQTATVNGILYTYASATNSWKKTVTTVGNLTITNTVGAGVLTVTGNATTGNITTGIVTAGGNVRAANVTTTGNVAASYVIATGNVQAAYVQGDGSKLTNLNAASTGKAIAMAIVFGG